MRGSDVADPYFPSYSWDMKRNKQIKTYTKNMRDITATEMANRLERDLHDEDYDRPSTSRRKISPARRSSPRRTVGAESQKHKDPRAQSRQKAVSVQRPKSPSRKVYTSRGESGSKNEEGSKPRDRPQKPPSLPDRGKPGGLDDPLRRGLSGAGAKWYLRFLAQGKEPEEARKLAVERKKEGSNTPEGQSQRKRGRDTITPPERPVSKRPKTTSTEGTSTVAAEKRRKTEAGTSYAGAVKNLRVAVLPKEYPVATLSTEELTALEDAIIEEIALGWVSKLQFEGISFRPGYLLVNCCNEQTAEWLLKAAARLSTWKGVELTACLGDDIPKSYTITVFLPRSSGQDQKKSLALIEAQNEGLNTNLWKVTSSRVEGKGKVVSFLIDEKSAETIKEQGHTIRYRFGKATVSGLRKQEAETHAGNDAAPAANPDSATEAGVGPAIPTGTTAAPATTVEEIPMSEEDTESVDLANLNLEDLAAIPLTEEEDEMEVGTGPSPTSP